MKIQNARRWAPAGPRPWIFAMLALLAASAIRGLLHPLLGPAAPGFAFSIAAALMEYYFGIAPALTVMTFGMVIADYLFVPPYGDLTHFDRSDVTLLVSHPAVAIVIIVLIERLRRSQYRSELVASVARSRYEILLRADNERLLARRDADETHRLLRALTHRRDQIVFLHAVDPVARGIHGSTIQARPLAPLTPITPLDPPAPSAPSAPFEGDGTQPGDRFDSVHPDDIERVLAVLTPGPHRVRKVGAVEGDPRLVDAICDRFTTPAGDFFILRLEA